MDINKEMKKDANYQASHVVGEELDKEIRKGKSPKIVDSGKIDMQRILRTNEDTDSTEEEEHVAASR